MGATRPPGFGYNPLMHKAIDIVMSDASDLYVPKVAPPVDKGLAVIKVSDKRTPKRRHGAMYHKEGDTLARFSSKEFQPLPENTPLAAKVIDPVNDPPATIGVPINQTQASKTEG